MSITIEQIKADYASLMSIIGNVTTIEQLKSLPNKEQFGYITVDNENFYHKNPYDKNAVYVMEDVSRIDNHILYGWYGCLGAIFVAISGNKIEAVYFDIWDDLNSFILAEQVTIDEVTEDTLKLWLENEQDFFAYCSKEDIVSGFDEDGFVEIKIKFVATGSDDTADNVFDNFYENYPEFYPNMDGEYYFRNKKTKEFVLVWGGKFKHDELDEDDIDTLVRLTHHAEGLYEGTDAEFVHVEVCIDGQWYGL